MKQASIILGIISAFIIFFAPLASAQELEEFKGTVGTQKGELALTQISDTEWAASLILKGYEKEFYGIVDQHSDENHGFTEIIDLLAIDGSDDFMHITYTTTAWMGVIESSVTGTLTRNGKDYKLKFESSQEMR